MEEEKEAERQSRIKSEMWTRGLAITAIVATLLGGTISGILSSKNSDTAQTLILNNSKEEPFYIYVDKSMYNDIFNRLKKVEYENEILKKRISEFEENKDFTLNLYDK